MMKIVQTSWACNQKNMLTFDAGWYAPEYHLMAWALSCLQLKKYYTEVELHADQVTANVLIDVLKLPYTKVICDLDQFNTNSPQLWALPKIHTYSQQTVPFLHVDGDVFIWKSLDELSGGLIAQNLEWGTSRYEKSFSDIESKLIFSSTVINEEKIKGNKIYAYNAGILGGSDLGFFQKYTTIAAELVAGNKGILPQISIPAFNVYFEQYLFYCLAAREHRKVNVLFDEVIPDDKYIGFGEFLEVPYNRQYLHLIGPPYKKNLQMCKQLANRLRQDYPEYYYRIIALFKSEKVHLKKDDYHFLNAATEKSLVERYFNLRNNQVDVLPVLTDENPAVQTAAPTYIPRILENLLNVIKKNSLQNVPDHDYAGIIKAAEVFEQQLSEVIKTKFSGYSSTGLYRRDIFHIHNFELLFGNKKSGYKKPLVFDNIVEILESTFDLTVFDGENIDFKKASAVLNEGPSSMYIVVVPECDQKGYTLLKIDELSKYLLVSMADQTNINEVMDKVKPAFDQDDLNNSLPEFEHLITGRIKNMLQAKLIKSADLNLI